MPNQDIDFEAVRRRAEKRTNEKIEFFIHLAVYVVVNLVLWALGIGVSGALNLGTWGFLLPLLVTLGWGIGLVIHGAKVYLEGNFKARMREQEIRRELELERLRLGINDEDDDMVLEKPKRKQRGRTVRLTDDGELADADEDKSEA